MGTRSDSIRKRTNGRSFLKLVAASILPFVLAACTDHGKPPGPGDDGEEHPSCVPVVEETHVPVKIESGRTLHFNQKAMKLLSDDSFKTTSVNLYVELEKKQPKYSVTVGLNGTVATRSDGSKDFDSDDDKHPGKKRLRLDFFRMNGGESLGMTLLRLQLLNAALKISLQGTNVYVKSAKLVVRGYYPRPCPSPTPKPSPTPVPVPPSVSITKVTPAAGKTALTSLNVEFASNQSGVTFLCSLDGSAETQCSSPLIRSGLSNGDHVFTVRARNAQGLISPEAAEHRWTVDSVPPVLSIDQPASPTNQATISISFSSTKDGEFTCKLNDSEPVSCSSPFVASGLSDGLQTFTLSQIDPLGNVSLPARVEWTVDLTPPTSQIVGSEPSASPSSATSREISFAASESSTFECSLDGGSFATCHSPHRIDGLSDGPHLFEVRAIDNAGNVGPAASTSWVTDLTPPSLTLGSAQPASGNTNASEFRVEFASSEPGTFFCRVNGGAETECTSPMSGAFDVDGRHSVEVVAQDLAGLRSSPKSIEWFVDRSAPEIHFSQILPSAAEFLAATSLEAHVHSQEAIELSASLNGSSLGSVASPIVLSNLAEGFFELSVTGVDLYGNATNTVTHAFTVDRTAPSLAVLAQYSGGQLTNRSSNSFTFSSNESVVFECELNESGYGPCISSKDVSGLIDGEHVFNVRARDRAGNVSAVSETRWNVDTTAPTTNLSGQQVAESAYRFLFSSNETGSTFRCSIDGASEFACSSPYTATFSVGAHVFKVHAVDPAGNRDPVGASYNAEVYPPIKTTLSHANIVLTNQTSMTFSFSSNRPNATFLCSLDGAAPRPCVSPMTVTGLGNGAHSFRVQAVDSFGNPDPVGASHSWTVDTVAPVIISSSNSTTSTTITVQWSLNESATGFLRWGLGFDTSRVTNENPSAASHSIQLTGLSPNTLYSIQISGRDQAGNVYNGTVVQIRTRF